MSALIAATRTGPSVRPSTNARSSSPGPPSGLAGTDRTAACPLDTGVGRPRDLQGPPGAAAERSGGTVEDLTTRVEEWMRARQSGTSIDSGF